LNRAKVEKLVAKNRVVTLKADKTHDSPEIDAFLKELGNPGAVIPFLAIFPADGREPITYDGPITQQMVLNALEQAGPSTGGKGQGVVEAARANVQLAR